MSQISNSVSNYKAKKLKSKEFEKLVAGRVGFSRAIEIQDCARVLNFITDKEFVKHKVWRMFTCKHPFCPTCIWRKARKDAMKIATIMKWIEQEHKKEFILLTLTYKRVPGTELSATIDKFQSAFNRMFNRKRVKDISKGYLKKLEVTYDNNEKITEEMYKRKKRYYDKQGLKVGMENGNYDTYHVHYHVLIAVNKSYFTDKRYYMSRVDWLEYWQRAMKDDSITQVDVRKVKNDEGSGAKEVAKYTAKDSDYLVNQDVFDTFSTALHRRRRIVYSGLFRDGAELYKNGKLDYLLEKDDTAYEWLIRYFWGDESYCEGEVRALTDDEKAEIFGEKIDEGEID